MNMPKSSELLSSIPFFKGLSTNELNEVGRVAFEKYFNKDEIIFSDGQRGDGSYLIIEGTVKVYKLSLHGKEHIFHFFSSESERAVTRRSRCHRWKYHHKSELEKSHDTA